MPNDGAKKPLPNTRFVFGLEEALELLQARGYEPIPGTGQQFREENAGQQVAIMVYVRRRDNAKCLLWTFNGNESFIFRRTDRREINFI